MSEHEGVWKIAGPWFFTYAECSECENFVEYYRNEKGPVLYNYCPLCGAKMRNGNMEKTKRKQIVDEQYRGSNGEAND